MKTKSRRNPKRSTLRNPSMLMTTLISGGAALASIALVSVAMQARRNKALKICARIGTLAEAIP